MHKLGDKIDLLSVFENIQKVLNHPLNKNQKGRAVLRILKWQLRARLSKSLIVHPFIDNTVLLAKKGMTGVTGHIYAGLYDFEEMAFLLHFLREEDLFFDIGANIGAYSVLASGICKAESLAFEPVPKTFQYLLQNMKTNHLEERVNCQQSGIGAFNKKIKITTHKDTGNQILASDEAHDSEMEVEVKRLDDIADRRIPILIKIDVEGYEHQVLSGAKHLLQSETLKAIIIELNSVSEKFGNSPEETHEFLLHNGFAPFRYFPKKREFEALASFATSPNTIYLRDKEFILDRVKNGKTFTILNQII